MPFLVDSLGIAFAARGVAVRMLIHPVLEARRDRNGRLRTLQLADMEGATAEPAITAGTRRESWQLYEVERLYDAAAMRDLEDALRHTLADVRAAVDDWQPMRRRMRELAAGLRARPPARTPAAETAEACHLLDWMEGGHFVFLGLPAPCPAPGPQQRPAGAGAALGARHPARSTR
jgi:glutamate dehydrogenase